MAVRIFRMNDTDWMAGETLASCVEEYQKNYLNREPEDGDLDEPRELTDEQMDRMIFCDMDVQPEQRRTFRQELDAMVARGVKFPTFFATTEY